MTAEARQMGRGAPSVFHYSDYRSFLKDAYATQKKYRPRWSYGSWARQLGLKSPSTLVMILKGQRNPSSQLTHALANRLHLSSKETEFFFDLVQFQKFRQNAAMSALLMEKLTKISRQNSGRAFKFLDHQTFSAISSWYFAAIRELVQLSDFREDPEWICRRLLFPVTPKAAREAIEILLKLGLLERKPNGRLSLAQGELDTVSDVADEGVKRFHEQVLENAKTSLRRTPPSQREIVGTTFPVPHSKMGKAKQLIRKFQQEFCDLLEESPSDAIYHLEIAFFPVAFSGDKEK